MYRAGDEVSGGLVLVQRVAEPSLDLLRLLRVVSTPLPQLVDGDSAVLEELVGHLSGGAVPVEGFGAARALREHAVGLLQQHLG